VQLAVARLGAELEVGDAHDVQRAGGCAEAAPSVVRAIQGPAEGDARGAAHVFAATVWWIWKVPAGTELRSVSQKRSASARRRC
jgi:hypothetical protein